MQLDSIPNCFGSTHIFPPFLYSIICPPHMIYRIPAYLISSSNYFWNLPYPHILTINPRSYGLYRIPLLPALDSTVYRLMELTIPLLALGIFLSQSYGSYRPPFASGTYRILTLYLPYSFRILPYSRFWSHAPIFPSFATTTLTISFFFSLLDFTVSLLLIPFSSHFWTLPYPLLSSGFYHIPFMNSTVPSFL